MSPYFVPCCFSTLGKAWQSLKAELRYRSEAHSKFAEEVSFKVIIMDCACVSVALPAFDFHCALLEIVQCMLL